MLDVEYITHEELYMAYLDCRKHKRQSTNSLEFELDDTLKLYHLWKDLNTKQYIIGRSITFCVNKPVKREVFAADFRDRIVHHLIIRRLIKTMDEDVFIDDSYSCRVGKGVLYGVKRCQEQLASIKKTHPNAYIIRGDLKSFFMSIDKDILMNQIVALLEMVYPDDPVQFNYMKWLVGLVVYNEPQINCIRKQPLSAWEGLPPHKSLFHSKKNTGIPIGNLTSQIFANFFLTVFDLYIQKLPHVLGYGRYVDDFWLLVDADAPVQEIIDGMREYLWNNLKTTLHPHKVYVQRINRGLKFIGAIIHDNRIYVANRTKGNFFRAIHSFNEDKYDTLEKMLHFESSINSYLGYMIHYSSFNLRKEITRANPHILKFYHTDESHTKILYCNRKKVA